MIEVKAYQDTAGCKPYADWLNSLTDSKTKARIVARVNRVAAGMFGDCKPLREGVQELKIDFGPGYGVYLSKQGQVLVLLLWAANVFAKADTRKLVRILQALLLQPSWLQLAYERIL